MGEATSLAIESYCADHVSTQGSQALAISTLGSQAVSTPLSESPATGWVQQLSSEPCPRG